MTIMNDTNMFVAQISNKGIDVILTMIQYYSQPSSNFPTAISEEVREKIRENTNIHTLELESLDQEVKNRMAKYHVLKLQEESGIIIQSFFYDIIKLFRNDPTAEDFKLFIDFLDLTTNISQSIKLIYLLAERLERIDICNTEKALQALYEEHHEEFLEKVKYYLGEDNQNTLNKENEINYDTYKTKFEELKQKACSFNNDIEYFEQQLAHLEATYLAQIIKRRDRLKEIMKIIINKIGIEDILKQTIQDLKEDKVSSTLMHILNAMDDTPPESPKNASDSINTPLYQVIERGYINVAEFLVQNGFRAYSGTFTHYPINNNSRIINLLIKAGADVNALDNKGRNSLHHAIFCKTLTEGCLGVLLLIKNEAKSVEDVVGKNPLYYAIKNLDFERALCLMSHGMDLGAARTDCNHYIYPNCAKDYSEFIKYIENSEDKKNYQYETYYNNIKRIMLGNNETLENVNTILEENYDAELSQDHDTRQSSKCSLTQQKKITRLLNNAAEKARSMFSKRKYQPLEDKNCIDNESLVKNTIRRMIKVIIALCKIREELQLNASHAKILLDQGVSFYLIKECMKIQKKIDATTHNEKASKIIYEYVKQDTDCCNKVKKCIMDTLSPPHIENKLETANLNTPQKPATFVNSNTVSQLATTTKALAS